MDCPDLLVSVDAYIDIGCEDSRYRHSSTEIANAVQSSSIPGSGDSTQRPDEIRDEEHDDRLIKTVKHVRPEFEPSVVQTPNATNIHLREGQGRARIDILVESWHHLSKKLLGPSVCDSPPREMTGRDVKMRLYSRMNVYSYR